MIRGRPTSSFGNKSFDSRVKTQLQSTAIVYHRFVRLSERFYRIMPWWFLAGVLGCILVSALKQPKHLGLVCALSVWPSLLLWFFFSGTTIVWRFVLEACRDEPRVVGVFGRILSVLILMLGISFLYGSIVLLTAMIGWVHCSDH